MNSKSKENVVVCFDGHVHGGPNTRALKFTLKCTGFYNFALSVFGSALFYYGQYIISLIIPFLCICEK